MYQCLACKVVNSYLFFAFRICINKQLEIEPEEHETEDKHKARKKTKRSKKETEESDMKGQTTELVLEPVAHSSPEVLMVEVDNVLHEDFQVTEEVKVSDRIV